MMFVESVVVHDHGVVTYKVAVVKNGEHVVNEEGEWDMVPRRQWAALKSDHGMTAGNIHKDNSRNPLSPQSEFARVDLDNDSSSGEEMDGDDITIQYLEEQNENEISKTNSIVDYGE